MSKHDYTGISDTNDVLIQLHGGGIKMDSTEFVKSTKGRLRQVRDSPLKRISGRLPESKTLTFTHYLNCLLNYNVTTSTVDFYLSNTVKVSHLCILNPFRRAQCTHCYFSNTSNMEHIFLMHLKIWDKHLSVQVLRQKRKEKKLYMFFLIFLFNFF